MAPNRITAVVFLSAVVAATILYANWTVNASADAALTEHSKSALPPNHDRFSIVKDANDTFLLMNMSSGKIVEGPLVLRENDGGVLAVRDKKLVRLSGGFIQNVVIWIFGPSRSF